jgi:tellurite methyltransferase
MIDHTYENLAAKECHVTAPTSDRERWNARYRNEEPGGTPLLLGRNLHLFPRLGRALDVAGGDGQAGAILAARGLEVTVADVSDVALALAAERAARSRLTLQTLQIDLTAEPFPDGPWHVITCFNYLDRDLFPAMIDNLAEGGYLGLSLATRSNLERHEHPAQRWLLNDGELPSLLGGLALVHHREGWGLDGRHTAEVLARKL